ncbi:MAG TPA: FmdB family zinc ribbon protein [Candidatus Angelobacter sp.]|nr:FmdB family zinc ribbon protein [Candidatus Angelobacter sp.]
MPTYGYRCQECGEEFDVWQRMSDEAKADCPKCGAAGKRLFFPAGIVFKGTGFYKTDSRKSSDGGAKPATTTTTPSKPSTSTSTASGSTPASTPSTSSGSDSGSTSSSAAAAAAD